MIVIVIVIMMMVRRSKQTSKPYRNILLLYSYYSYKDATTDTYDSNTHTNTSNSTTTTTTYNNNNNNLIWTPSIPGVSTDNETTLGAPLINREETSEPIKNILCDPRWGMYDTRTAECLQRAYRERTHVWRWGLVAHILSNTHKSTLRTLQHWAPPPPLASYYTYYY